MSARCRRRLHSLDVVRHGLTREAPETETSEANGRTSKTYWRVPSACLEGRHGARGRVLRTSARCPGVDDKSSSNALRRKIYLFPGASSFSIPPLCQGRQRDVTLGMRSSSASQAQFAKPIFIIDLLLPSLLSALVRNALLLQSEPALWLAVVHEIFQHIWSGRVFSVLRRVACLLSHVKDSC